MENLSITDIVEIAGVVVALASAVAAVTKTDSDNRIIAGMIRFLDALALNLNRRNPRKVEGEAKREVARRRASRTGHLPSLAALLPLAGVLALGACAQLQQGRETMADYHGLFGTMDRAALDRAIAAGEASELWPDLLSAETVDRWRVACPMLILLEPRDVMLIEDCGRVLRIVSSPAS